MKLTILETGLPPEPLRADWPTYPVMFEHLISAVDDGFSYETVSIVSGEPFPDPHTLEGVIHTGSAFGVYDDGGRAEKSDKGWGLGRHEYATPFRPDWMATGPETFTLAVSHQDQVTAIPEGAKVTARSDFCEYAGLVYGCSPSASFQGHPEFDADFCSALHESRRARIGDELVDAALGSFAKPLTRSVVALWMADFFKANARAR